MSFEQWLKSEGVKRFEELPEAVKESLRKSFDALSKPPVKSGSEPGFSAKGKSTLS
jgi:hypothetical protein